MTWATRAIPSHATTDLEVGAGGHHSRVQRRIGGVDPRGGERAPQQALSAAQRRTALTGDLGVAGTVGDKTHHLELRLCETGEDVSVRQIVPHGLVGGVGQHGLHRLDDAHPIVEILLAQERNVGVVAGERRPGEPRVGDPGEEYDAEVGSAPTYRLCEFDPVRPDAEIDIDDQRVEGLGGGNGVHLDARGEAGGVQEVADQLLHQRLVLDHEHPTAEFRIGGRVLHHTDRTGEGRGREVLSMRAQHQLSQSRSTARCAGGRRHG